MSHIESTTKDYVRTITLNRPEKLNAFAATMREDLLGALGETERDRSCRLVVITGAGRAFCSGGDLEFMRGLQRDHNAEGMRKLLAAGGAVITQIVEMSKPVIASINGVAAGAGCNLALACDYRIASDQAKIGENFVRIRIHSDWGGAWAAAPPSGLHRAVE